jgi:GNAT superfamily N-acetyltransferase
MAHEEIRFVPASSVSPTLVWKAFVEGFQGYIVPVKIDEEPFARMIATEHVDLTASVVALDNADEPLGICLLAVRGGVGWCGGLGVVPTMRRKGLGRELMVRSIAEARARGLERYLLECINGNEAAHRLYRDLGFEVIRRLDFFDGIPASVPARDDHSSHIWVMDHPTSVWADFGVYHRVRRPWQQDAPSLQLTTAAESTAGLAAGDPGRPEAYLIYRVPAQVGARVPIIDTGCLSAGRDERASLTSLLAGLIAMFPGDRLQAVNVPDDDPFNHVLHAAGVPVSLSQSEMDLNLREVR